MHVVVPDGAIRSKLAAIEAYGASLHRCAPTIAAREQTAEHVRRETGATLVHPYTNPQVIAGQGTAAIELIEQAGPDVLIAPIGGGGLLAAARSRPGRLLHGPVYSRRNRAVRATHPCR